jgi:hypothetical protein
VNRKLRKKLQAKMKKAVIRSNSSDREVHLAPCEKCSLRAACGAEDLTCEGYRHYCTEEESNYDHDKCISGIGKNFKPIPIEDE